MRTLSGIAALMTMTLFMSSVAWAHSPRVHWGIHIGVPWVLPPFYRAYPGYPPPRVMLPPGSYPVYIEREQAPANTDTGYWYYCNELKAYYPYVKECPSQWQLVAPQPFQQ